VKIGITYNLRRANDEHDEEFDMPHTIEALSEVFKNNGHETVKLGYGPGIIKRISEEGVDFVFNIAEGSGTRNRESYVPAILEMLGIPYSGSDPLTLGLALDKILAKKIAVSAGIPVPRYRVINKPSDIAGIERELTFPLITKPAWEGSSKGIYNSSKVSSVSELERNIAVLSEKYPGEPVIAEEYIAGREITVGVIGNGSPRVLGLMEVVNKVNPGEDFFYSLEVKRDWKNLVDYECPARLTPVLENNIKKYALRAFSEFGCKDIARIDFRVSGDGKPFLLELNPLPGLSPEYADLVIMAKKQGIAYGEIVLAVLKSALSRFNRETR
jgi:D-alanine-D-alanine ligase